MADEKAFFLISGSNIISNTAYELLPTLQQQYVYEVQNYVPNKDKIKPIKLVNSLT